MTMLLVRRFLRRDRWMLLWWSVGAALLYFSQAVSVKGLYATQAEFDRAATSMGSNPAFVAMAGPARALDTIGGQVTWQATAFGAVVAGLMSMFLVGRHTRAEEESGRDELLRAAGIDRRTPMTSGLIVALLANALLGLVVSVSLIAFPLAAADSLALGVGLTLTGWFFTGVALLAAQLTSSTRATYGLTGAVIATTYVVRAAGDVGEQGLSWLSPIGWYQAMHAFSGLRWWPAGLLLGAAAATVAVAYVVFDRRDFADGVVPTRPGPSIASGQLRSGVGLAWRLQRGALLGWAAGLLLVGVAYGSLGADVGDLMGDSDTTREVFAQGGGSLVDGFYATALLLLGLMAAGYTISAALRARSEEESSRVEMLLATPLTRRRWLLGHLWMAAAGTVVVVLAGGAGLGLGYVATTGDATTAATYVLGEVEYVAPALVLGGVAGLAHALVPRWATVAWSGLALAVVVAFFGPLLKLPQWFQNASPFEHLALVPAEDFAPGAVAGVLIVAVGLGSGAVIAFARRDVR